MCLYIGRKNYYGGNVNALEWAIRVIDLRRS